MNIFMLDKDLEINAQYMVDKHVVKMPLESAQILCSALHLSGQDAPYKLTHKNHPCCVWCRTSIDNWLYLKCLALEICKEYTYRYGKIHKAELIIRSLETPNLTSIGRTELPSCMDKNYVVSDDVVENYRNYYKNGKKNIHSWKRREVPDWIESFT